MSIKGMKKALKPILDLDLKLLIVRSKILGVDLYWMITSWVMIFE
jgi:hypothetical protein